MYVVALDAFQLIVLSSSLCCCLNSTKMAEFVFWSISESASPINTVSSLMTIMLVEKIASLEWCKIKTSRYSSTIAAWIQATLEAALKATKSLTPYVLAFWSCLLNIYYFFFFRKSSLCFWSHKSFNTFKFTSPVGFTWFASLLVEWLSLLSLLSSSEISNLCISYSFNWILWCYSASCRQSLISFTVREDSVLVCTLASSTQPPWHFRLYTLACILAWHIPVGLRWCHPQGELTRLFFPLEVTLPEQQESRVKYNFTTAFCETFLTTPDSFLRRDWVTAVNSIKLHEVLEFRQGLVHLCLPLFIHITLLRLCLLPAVRHRVAACSKLQKKMCLPCVYLVV